MYWQNSNQNFLLINNNILLIINLLISIYLYICGSKKKDAIIIGDYSFIRVEAFKKLLI